MSEDRDTRSGPSLRQVPDGDNMVRLVCPDCGFVQYDNPKIVVGAVATWEGRILLCRRAIDPRSGYWTLPAGYLELNETAPEGAAREAWEEARARLDISALLAVYNIPRISQVQLIYRAVLVSADVSAGPESAAVGLFDWDGIPWDELAFPSVRWALHHWREVQDEPVFAPRGNPPGEVGDYE
ncbi:MAG: NUDIX domain-containing protein [Alphaproteobacteria bacterium]|nr:NUDIX domain-containing protein [Alphaproteobacteria bacterium]